MPTPPPPAGRVLMVQGTSSHAGKSTLVAALCRLFARAGYRVAPFKAQNMSNNAAVTPEGGEVGRAQALQAMAAGVPPAVQMNPILLKPQSDRTSQVITLGRVWCTADARTYYALGSELWPIVTGALDTLRAAHDVVVIEGAGSPAEINLAGVDLVNMRVARYVDAPVLLVGDIDRGGVFAALYGTVALLAPEDRALVRGFVINKFRGDPALLEPGPAMLHERTGIPTLGVLPHLDLSRLPAEDALDWSVRRSHDGGPARLDIVVVRLPRIANLDEFQPLMNESGVRVRFVAHAADVGDPDLIIVPGTKSTMADLAWVRARGLDVALAAQRAKGTPLLGICGGFQMLGARIADADGAETRGDAPGLGLLDVATTFSLQKVTRQVGVRVTGANALWAPHDACARDAENGSEAMPLGSAVLAGYEIHMGRTTPTRGADLGAPPFVRCTADGVLADGASSRDGLVVGTYVHGLLENAALRHALLARLAARKGVDYPDGHDTATVDDAIDALADAVREHLDLAAIAAMTGLSRLARSP